MAPPEPDQTIRLHPAQFLRQRGAFHVQIVCELLAVERDVEPPRRKRRIRESEYLQRLQRFKVLCHKKCVTKCYLTVFGRTPARTPDLILAGGSMRISLAFIVR